MKTARPTAHDPVTDLVTAKLDAIRRKAGVQKNAGEPGFFFCTTRVRRSRPLTTAERLASARNQMAALRARLNRSTQH